MRQRFELLRRVTLGPLALVGLLLVLLIEKLMKTVSHGLVFISGGVMVTYNSADIRLTRWEVILCTVPWPGRKEWSATILTQAMLLGGEPEYVAVSEWDWDEAWAINIGDDSAIASSNKTACAIAFLKHKGAYSGSRT